MKRKLLTLAITLTFSLTNVTAKENQPEKIAAPNFYGTTVSFSTTKSLASGSEITIAGPDNFRATKASKYGMPSIQLANHGFVVDGKYNYRLVIKSGATIQLLDNGLNNGRDSEKKYYGVKSVVETGHFYVKHGNIQSFDNVKEFERK